MDRDKIQVLLVEDIKIAQTVAQLILSQLTCKVTTAATGIDALELLEQQQFDIIFMDLGLPDIDGITITETIRKQEQACSRTAIPIIALTAHSNDKTLKQQCFETGIDDFLTKPLQIKEAKRVLEQYCKIPETRMV